MLEMISKGQTWHPHISKPFICVQSKIIAPSFHIKQPIQTETLKYPSGWKHISQYEYIDVKKLPEIQHKVHKQRGPPPHTHSSMDSFINNMSQSGWLFITAVFLYIPVLGTDSANRAKREGDGSKPQSSRGDQKWADNKLTRGCVCLW